MAKHIVKCLYCHQQFDTNDPSIKWTKPITNRYAHQECYDKIDSTKKAEQKEEEELNKYISSVLGKTLDWPKVQKQIRSYHAKYNFTYTGMLSTLKYIFEIEKKTNIQAANGGIGLIPYKYKEAYNYYYNIYLAQQRNTNQNYQPVIQKITIESPCSWAAPPKLWFEDEEEVDN